MIDYVEEEIVRHEWTGNVDNISRGPLLVRCNDCKFSRETPIIYIRNEKIWCVQLNKHKPREFYCADGERKDEQD